MVAMGVLTSARRIVAPRARGPRANIPLEDQYDYDPARDIHVKKPLNRAPVIDDVRSMHPHTWDPQRKLFLPTREKQFSYDRMGKRNMQFVVANAGGGAGLLASTYDGTNDYALRGGSWTGAADSKLIITSFWWKSSATAATYGLIRSGFSGANKGFHTIDAKPANLSTDGQSPSDLRTWLVQTTGIDPFDGNWHHFLFSFKGTTPEVHLFVDDADAATGAQSNDRIQDFTLEEMSIGAQADGGSKFPGDLSEIYIHPGEFLDFTTEANRRLFIDAAGKPVDLGADGSTPTSTQPIVYAPDGDPSINLGTGGNYSITGALVSADGPGV